MGTRQRPGPAARVAEIIGPALQDMGFELVRVRLAEGKRATLQIMAERPDGTMGIDDCAEVSRVVSALLDVEDPIESAYHLEVSSPGIDRPLTRRKDFERWAGFEAKLETVELIDGRKRFRGELLGVEGDEVMIRADDAGETAVRRVPLEAIDKASLVLTDALIAASLNDRD